MGDLLSMDEPRRRIAAMLSGLDIRYDLGDRHPLLGRRTAIPWWNVVRRPGPPASHGRAARRHGREAGDTVADMGDIVEFPSNGHGASGYLAVPESGSGPGLVVIQEYWGLVPHIKDVCDRFAVEGFVALAPDLFHGETTTEPDEAGKLMMAMNVDRAAQDLSGAVDLLLGHDAVTGTKVGITGFCMGGGLALVAACDRPDAYGAVVPWYGLIPWPDAEPDWTALQAPVEGHFAGDDGFFTADAARDLEDKLRKAGNAATLFIYEGVDHAFFNDTRPEVYDAEAAATAWGRTLDFLRTRLG
ncbi:dienelactone hydrolase family protein [soil metagenome]